jgi:hypothetical protein
LPELGGKRKSPARWAAGVTPAPSEEDENLRSANFRRG